MPTLTPEYIAIAALIGVSFGLFFKGWQVYSIIFFIMAWEMFTPLRPFWQDVPLLFSCAMTTEFFFQAFKHLTFLINENHKLKKTCGHSTLEAPLFMDECEECKKYVKKRLKLNE